jgi:uncharacterized membrane protein YozB (DUF420 family)
MIVLSVFGGLASATAGWFFGLVFVGSIIRAYWCIKHKNITAHKERMIRAICNRLGFCINLLIAETWINLTRAKNFIKAKK